MDRPYSILPVKEFPEIFVANPLRKDKSIHIETALYCSFLERRGDVVWGHIGTGSPENSRNSLIEDHIRSGSNFTHAVFIDSDVVPPLRGMIDLLIMQADIAVGVCPILLDGGLYWNVTDDDDNFIPFNEELPEKPFEVQSAGAGFMMVRREVFDTVGWPYFKTEYQSKNETGEDSIKCGEDIYFCRKVKEHGFKVYAHPEVICKHYNQVDLVGAYSLIKNQIETGNVKKIKA